MYIERLLEDGSVMGSVRRVHKMQYSFFLSAILVAENLLRLAYWGDFVALPRTISSAFHSLLQLSYSN